ncbi:hypothetical protein [Gimesia sp.]|uniref:hypothetical protein n=1 Tax=Gimesia sp. TaxID=2024833 RepID=UPI003A91A8D0
MSKLKYLLMFMLVFPQSYLAVLLAFDLKYYDANEMAFTVPMYPWPTYMKVILAVISFIMTSAFLIYFDAYQRKVNSPGDATIKQDTI